MSDKTNNKFQFTVEWQYDLIRFILQDRDGYRAIRKISSDYFTLIEHNVIAHTIIDFYNKNHKIPGETILRERVIKMMGSREFVKLITKDEQDIILKLIPKLYTAVVRDGDEIYDMCKKFSAFIRLKNLLEEIDPRDWEQYEKYQHKFQNVIEDEDNQVEREASFLFANVVQRQVKRRETKTIIPTPFSQINKLTNANGYEIGSILVVLDKQKKGKTAALVNIAKGYLRQGKKVLYLDYENGQDSIFSRFEQSLTNSTKLDILTGEADNLVKRKFRKYKRIGGEVIVERVPSGADANYIQYNIIDKYYREYGIKFDILISDYAGKMGSLSKKRDDTERISDAYNDLANLVMKNGIEHCWTANHVTRDAATQRMKTRYRGEDIAKCIDISRHVHAIYGLNRSPEEEEAGFIRMELVEQRDGVSQGRAVFTINHDTQNMKELTKAERLEYDELFSEHLGEEESPSERSTKQKKSNDDFS
jgi:hypothetical protein